jgi:hypothetical protein
MSPGDDPDTDGPPDPQRTAEQPTATPADGSRVGRWRDAFGPKWFAGIVSALVVAAAITVGAAVLNTPPSKAPPVTTAGVQSQASAPLRVTIVPQAQEVFDVAFAGDIGLPSEQTRWSDLIDRGGVDVGVELLRMTLANRSEHPLTIHDIHLEVTRAAPAPHGSLAYVFTQGGGALGQYTAEISRAIPTSTATLDTTGESGPAPYFLKHYIHLRPDEIYEANVGVQTASDVRRLVSYRFVIAGSTPTRELTVKTRAVGRLSGLLGGVGSDAYEHYYLRDYLGFVARDPTCRGVRVQTWFAVPRHFRGGCPT